MLEFCRLLLQLPSGFPLVSLRRVGCQVITCRSVLSVKGENLQDLLTALSSSLEGLDRSRFEKAFQSKILIFMFFLILRIVEDLLDGGSPGVFFKQPLTLL